LLIDVLHYLPRNEQDATLARAAAALSSGGRILVRELDARQGVRSTLTRVSERIGVAVGMNRGRSRFGFRSAQEIVERLEALGCSCSLRAASQGTPFANVLIVASRTLDN
jgi:O-methyltransferase involved in polyketide biosynthesis